VDRPVKLLRGFTKVALGRAEKETVKFTVRARDLAYYDPKSSAWRVEPVEHEILVGGSSRPADLLKASFHITGAGISQGKLSDALTRDWPAAAWSPGTRSGRDALPAWPGTRR